MKFIHCADLHLDTPFAGLSDSRSAEIRQAELRQTFLRIIELAKDCDALLISGDLFDQNSVEAETIRTLAKGFSSLGETKVFIAAGNHDPLHEQSYYRLAGFSSNVHIFAPQTECVPVGDCDVYGVSFRQGLQPESLLAGFRATEGRPSVMVMHGNIGGGDYNPITREEIAESGLSYLALGHVHNYQEMRLGNTLCAYPGCPEGRGFDELGEKGVIIGEVTKEGITASFMPISGRMYHEVSLNIAGMDTQEELITAVREKLGSVKDLYKIVLMGESELVPRKEVIKEALSEFFFVKIYDRTERPLELAALARETGLRGLFAQKILAGMSKEKETLYRRALMYGMAAMDGEKVKLK